MDETGEEGWARYPVIKKGDVAAQPLSTGNAFLSFLISFLYKPTSMLMIYKPKNK